MFEGRGPLAILLLVLVGGLALNLTPCVLPMIPINLAIIGAGAQAQSRGRGFLLGSAYGAAMALVYGVLGLVVILTAGTFGTINSSPWFNLGIAVLFVVLGLAMFDVLLIDFSRYSSTIRAAAAQRGSVAAGVQHGRGRGAARRRLRRAGRHPGRAVLEQPLRDRHDGRARAAVLPRHRHGDSVADRRRRPRGAAEARACGWCASSRRSACSSWRPPRTTATRRTRIFANRWVDPAAVASSVQEQLKAGWHASLAEGSAAAKREQKPVLIDMWATWCKNCLTMDKTTLASEDVKKALVGLREDQVPGGRPGRAAGQRSPAAPVRRRAPRLRDPEAEELTFLTRPRRAHADLQARRAEFVTSTGPLQ